MMEEFCSKLGVIADLGAPEMRATATAKMTAKGIKQYEVDVLQSTALLLDKTAQMGGASNVSNGDCRSISTGFEVIRERVDVWSTDSIAQTS
jgi:hypothetical protein